MIFGAGAVVLAFGLFPSLAGVRNPQDSKALVRSEVAAHRAPAHAGDHERVDEAPARDFENWLQRYLAAIPSQRATLVEEGIEAARRRRPLLRKLIETDPAKALAMTPEVDIREQLPAGILAEMESVVSGTGDIFSMCSTGGPHECHEDHGARVGAQRYAVHLFGRRHGYPDAHGLSIYGVALDGHLAVWDSPLRRIGEQDDGKVVVEVHGERRAIGSFAEAYALEQDIRKEELRVVFNDDGTDQVDRESGVESASTGRKRFLVLQIDFPDLPGAFAGREEIGSFFDGVSAYYDENSYGKLGIDFTIVEGAVRLPFAVAEYVNTRGSQGLADDALQAVADRHDADAFDCVIFVFASIAPSSPGNFYWAGLGGGGRVWINGSLRKDVVCHEIGHHFGVGHAGSWAPADQNPLSQTGRHITYGDPADVMAMSAGGEPGHFNPVFKHRLGWLPDHAVAEVRESGVYRIWSYDDGRADIDRPVALKLFRGQRDLWVSFRQQKFPHLPAYASGATVLRASLDAYRVEILDLNTPGLTTSDSPLLPGQVLDDPDYGVRVSALSRSGAGAEEFMDFEVTLTPLPKNVLVDYGRAMAGVKEDTFGVRRFSSGSWTSLAVLSDNRVQFGGVAVFPALAELPSDLVLAAEVDARSDIYGINTAVSADGRAFVWGDNQAMMGDLPALITGVREISASDGHAAVLEMRGRVSTFGRVPLAEANSEGVVHIASNRSDLFFLHQDGTISSTRAFSSSDLSEFNDVVAIAVSDHHILGLRMDGTVVGHAWGDNASGEATPPDGLANVRQIAADNFISAALTEDGRLVRWGEERPVNTLPMLPIAAMDLRDYHCLVLLHQNSPHFTLQPVPAPARNAGLQRMTAFATGSSRLSYHWQRRDKPGAEWVDLEDAGQFYGSSTSSLFIAAPQSAYAGSEFRCVATDADGTRANSMPAAVIPAEAVAPRISGASRIQAGKTLELEVAFDAAGSIQWYRNGVAIMGANAASLAIEAAREESAGDYSVTATTSFGVFQSERLFSVVVDPAPVAEHPVANEPILETPRAEAPVLGRLVNMSTRAAVGSGEHALISGFVVGGAPANDILVRAVGQGLSSFGVDNVLVNPALALIRRDGSVLAANDDWAASPSESMLAEAMTRTGAFTLDPSEHDAAVCLAIEPGEYTALVAGPGESGVALVEVFDNADDEQVHFTNLSTRGFVGTGGDVMIAGIAIEGGPLPVLIRAVGPGLRSFGVADVLERPSLTVHSGDTVVFTNQSWVEQQAEIDDATRRVGTFPLAEAADAAVLVTLEPGPYTIVVHGLEDTRGVALVEVYDAR